MGFEGALVMVAAASQEQEQGCFEGSLSHCGHMVTAIMGVWCSWAWAIEASQAMDRGRLAAGTVLDGASPRFFPAPRPAEPRRTAVSPHAPLKKFWKAILPT